MNTNGPKLLVDPSTVNWPSIRCGDVKPNPIKIIVGEDVAEWQIRTCPWWLDAEWIPGQLMVRPGNCGRHRGSIQLEADGEQVAVEVTAHIRGTPALACWTAAKILLIGLVTVPLGAILGMSCVVGIPLLGGILGVAFAGAVFCSLLGLVIGGRVLATRTGSAGGISLFGTAVLVLPLLLYGSAMLGDLIAFRISLAVAGAMVGSAVGAVWGGTGLAVRSGLVGWVAWFTATLIAVPRFTTGPGTGPVVLLALFFTPGLGLTIWGVVMGGLLAPFRQIPLARSVAKRGEEKDAETQNPFATSSPGEQAARD
jgi:hypothetical protein